MITKSVGRVNLVLIALFYTYIAFFLISFILFGRSWFWLKTLPDGSKRLSDQTKLLLSVLSIIAMMWIGVYLTYRFDTIAFISGLILYFNVIMYIIRSVSPPSPRNDPKDIDELPLRATRGV